MNKGDFGYGSTVEATFQRHGGIDEFQSIFNETSNKIFKINKNVSTLEGLSKSFNSYSGPKSAEVKIHSLSQETNKLAREIKNKFRLMSEFINSSTNYRYDPRGNKLNQNKLQQSKLKQEFENSLSRYHAIQNTLSLKLKSHIDEELHISPMKRDGSADFQNDSSDHAPLIDYMDSQAQLQAEQEDLEAIRERESRIRQIETDILDVNEIFRDLAVIIHEQGDTIDSIESNLEQAFVHVEQANVQLQRAKDYQKSARKRLCIIFIVAVVVAGIIGLIVYLTSSSN